MEIADGQCRHQQTPTMIMQRKVGKQYSSRACHRWRVFLPCSFISHANKSKEPQYCSKELSHAVLIRQTIACSACSAGAGHRTGSCSCTGFLMFCNFLFSLLLQYQHQMVFNMRYNRSNVTFAVCPVVLVHYVMRAFYPKVSVLQMYR